MKKDLNGNYHLIALFSSVHFYHNQSLADISLLVLEAKEEQINEVQPCILSFISGICSVPKKK